MHLSDEFLDHGLGHVEIGNYTFPHRADGLDTSRCAAQHQLGVLTHRQNALLPIFNVISDHRRLVQDDPLAFDIDKSVRRSEVDRHIRGKQSAEGHFRCPNPYVAFTEPAPGEPLALICLARPD